jgi:hypothetical protein
MISCKNSKNSESAGSRRGCCGNVATGRQPFQPNGEILLQICCRCSDDRSAMQLSRAFCVERVAGDFAPVRYRWRVGVDFRRIGAENA